MQCALNRDKSLTTLGGCKETCSESKFRIITPILEILWNFPFKIILQNSRYCFEMFYLEYFDFNANLQSIIGNVNTFVKHVQRANSRSQKKKKDKNWSAKILFQVYLRSYEQFTLDEARWKQSDTAINIEPSHSIMRILK